MWTIETSPLMDVLAWTIIHSLWQGAIVFVTIQGYFLLRRRLGAAHKFNVTFIGLVAIFVLFIGTFFSLMAGKGGETDGLTADSVTIYVTGQLVEAGGLGLVDFINGRTNFIYNFWLFGFGVILIKYLISYIWIVRNTHRASFADLTAYGISMDKILRAMDIRGEVWVKNYPHHVSPFTMGIVRSVIYLPATVVSGLTTGEIEAILAHELAHIRRHDFDTNLIASMVEAVLYYHPVVWWLQQQINIHRENACDDEAITYTGNAMVYAKALIHIQENLVEHTSPPLTLAFSGSNKQLLLNRIKRLFNMPYSPVNLREKLLASIVLFLFAIGFTELYAYKTDHKDMSLLKEIDVVISSYKDDHGIVDSIPKVKKKESVSIIKSDGNKEIELKMENGEITKLKIDGKEIPPESYKDHAAEIEEMKPHQWDGHEPFDPDMENAFDFSFKMDEDMKNGLRDFKFMFPGKEGMVKLDSLHQLFAFKNDSLMNLADVFRFKSDSLMKFHLKFPEMEGHMFQFGFPEDGFHFDGPRAFHFEFPEGEMQEHIVREFESRMKEGHPFRNREAPHFKEDRNLEELIGTELNKDGFLIAGKNNKIELSGKNLKINGEKQPSNIWNKYKNLFERETGMVLSKDTKLVFEVEGKEAKRKYKAF
ncbi:MAG: M56 family metallopeptidase [Saprospiraceae bacterium]|nr:M56 family metallopeptidase [Saprospiraceae bacterium]